MPWAQEVPGSNPGAPTIYFNNMLFEGPNSLGTHIGLKWPRFISVSGPTL